MSAAATAGQGAFAAALLDPALPCPQGLRAWNGSDPSVRLGVYRNNVVTSLAGALADTFPVVRELVGGEFFDAMAAVFLRASPPRVRVLAHYGQEFPAFVETFEPARAVPYLADVARLEMARLQSLHAADALPLDAASARDALAAGEQAAEARFVLHPSLRLVRSPYAVASIWGAHQGHGDLSDVDPDRAQAALVLRPALDVLVLACDLPTHDFVEGLQQGAPLAQAAGAAAAAGALDLAAALGLLLSHGAVTAIHLPEVPRS